MSNLGKLKSQEGVSVVEVLVALTIMTIAIAASNAYFGEFANKKRKNRLRDVQQRIASVLHNSLKSPADIYYSVSRHDRNPSLAACLLGVTLPGNPGLNCTEVRRIAGSQQHTFGLYKVTDASGTAGKALSHSESGEMVYYDINGATCESNNPQADCAFEAETDFYITCNTGTDPNCENGATQAFFSYQVKQVEGTYTGLGSPLPPYPKIRRYSSMSTVQILGPQRFSECGSGVPQLAGFDPANAGNFSNEFTNGYYATLVGYDDVGKPVCQCVYPFEKVADEVDPKTGLTVPVCRLLTQQELACGAGEYLRGAKDGEDDRELICVNEGEAFNCIQMASYDDCPADHWITRSVNQNCLFSCDYIPTENRECKFEWEHLRGDIPQPGNNLANDGAQGDFSCEQEMYCCKPSFYGSGQ